MESNYRFVVATAFAAASLASVSNAGLVGTNCSLRYFAASTDATYQEQSFIVSNLLPEFYYGVDFGATYGAFSVDVKSSSMTVTFDYDAPYIYFAEGDRLALTIPASLQFGGFTLGPSNDITGLELSDLSGSGTRTLLIDASLITTSAPGASFTINFTTSAVPGPSALVILSACAAFTARRRRG